MVFSAWAGPVTAVGLHLVYVLFLYFGDGTTQKAVDSTSARS